MQVPGNWANVPGLDEDIAEANDEADKPQADEAEAHSGYKAAMAKREAANYAAEHSFVSAPAREIHEHMATLKQEDQKMTKEEYANLTPTQAGKLYERVAAPEAADDGKPDRIHLHKKKTNVPVRELNDVSAPAVLRKNKDDEIFNMDDVSMKHQSGIYKQNLLNDNAPPGEKQAKAVKPTSASKSVVDKREASVAAAEVQWEHQADARKGKAVASVSAATAPVKKTVVPAVVHAENGAVVNDEKTSAPMTPEMVGKAMAKLSTKVPH